jgi:hypothetical protein
MKQYYIKDYLHDSVLTTWYSWAMPAMPKPAALTAARGKTRRQESLILVPLPHSFLSYLHFSSFY